MHRTSRAQSEVVGVVLLTGVILLVVVLVGVVLLSTVESETERDPLADIESSVDESSVTLRHRGGDTFDAETTELRIFGSVEATVRLSDEFIVTDAGDQFAPGTVWRYENTALSGTITVLVVDTRTNTVVHDARHDIPAGS